MYLKNNINKYVYKTTKCYNTVGKYLINRICKLHKFRFSNFNFNLDSIIIFSVVYNATIFFKLAVIILEKQHIVIRY